jgi:hypothetical protein
MFILSNLIVVVALYITSFTLLLKIFLWIIAVKLSYRYFLYQTRIKAFYFIDRVGKAILLTRQNQQIKANNIEIISYNTLYIVMIFSCKSTKYRVLLFRYKITEELFKSLIILAKYNFLPVIALG